MSAPRRLIVGSRASPLALAQNEEVLSQLRSYLPDTELVTVTITTRGDREKDAPLLSLGRGTFVKEIEAALLRSEIDFAVHSAKDLEAALPDGLTLAAVGRRLDPRDVLVNKLGSTLMELPEGTRIGTSSPRRTALLKALRPDLRVLPIRGNVGSRLEKAAGDKYDGVVLAAAGLLRLGREAEVCEFLSPESFTPEVGQGTLAIEARAGDGPVLDLLAKVDHGPSNIALQAERAFLTALGGGCRVPITAYSRLEEQQLHIMAMAATLDGSRVFRTRLSCDAEDPVAAGRLAADSLMEAGAGVIVDVG